MTSDQIRAAGLTRYADQVYEILSAVRAAGAQGLTQAAMFRQFWAKDFGEYENPIASNFARWLSIASRLARAGHLTETGVIPCLIFTIP